MDGKLLFFVVILSIISVPQMVKATNIEYYESLVNLNSSIADYTLTFVFSKPPTGEFEYPLQFHIDNLKTTSNFKNYTCVPESESWGTLIKCDFSRATKEGRAISIMFDTKDNIKKYDNVFYFSTRISVPENVSRMTIKAVLDKGFVLIEKSNEPTALIPFLPKDGHEGSDGRHIYIVWERDNLEKGDVVDVSISYERIIPETNDNYLFPLIGILILITALITWAKVKKQAPSNSEISVLMEDEKRVIDILKEHNGMCKQRDKTLI